ncbi:MAG: CoA-disulfide reductase, partial [Candidatus Riflebacteria bacterium]|nr:CoA-disulfide reductase [Candidatus Riflebacteria bacterium]
AGGQPPLVLDVRNLPERQGGALVEDAMHIPLPELRDRLGELPQGREIWVHCAMGQRAHYATRILRQHGFDARNLSGGFRLRKVRG